MIENIANHNAKHFLSNIKILNTEITVPKTNENLGPDLEQAQNTATG